MTTTAEREAKRLLRQKPTSELKALRAKALDAFDVHSAAFLDKLLAERGERDE